MRSSRACCSGVRNARESCNRGRLNESWVVWTQIAGKDAVVVMCSSVSYREGERGRQERRVVFLPLSHSPPLPLSSFHQSIGLRASDGGNWAEIGRAHV